MKASHLCQILVISAAVIAVFPGLAEAAASGSALSTMAKVLSFRTGSVGWLILALAGIRACVDFFMNGRDMSIFVKFLMGCAFFPFIVMFVEYCATKAG